MSGNELIIVLESNEKARAVIARALQAAGLGACEVKAGDPGAVKVGGESLPKPVRLGAVIDAARKAVGVTMPQLLRFGPYTLDYAVHVLRQNKGKSADIKLTEKEAQVLVLLHNAKGKAVGREELLRAVWGYGGDIDTHTLETHIYRLRQKIEADAAQPELLLTSGSGYSLKI